MNFYSAFYSSWFVLPIIFLVWVTVLLFLKRILYAFIYRIAKNTKNELDDILVKSIDFPLTLLIITSGGLVVENLIPQSETGDLTNFFLVAFKAVAVVAAVLFVDKFLNALIRHYSPRIEILKTSGGVAQSLIRILVISFGILILMDSFGVSITPIIASLGIGSLAVALALQPTLENFFSGIQLVADKAIQAGHFIKIESGDEGYVERIGWRSTWIRTVRNYVIVIPNKELVNSKITNYYYPERKMSVALDVGVHYNSDLEHVERVTIEVARETLETVIGGDKAVDPFIRYHSFNDFSINFNVILNVKEIVDSYTIKHEFIKKLHARYAKEGINIPYPIRAINYDQEKRFGEENT